ncbi:MAG: hxuA 2, partial [Gammaproteobacteria bacterium]|nr:hxuA 2 [Gammaproteobacteria bacterium]
MIKKLMVFLATLILINSTYANPEGGVVAAGSATITAPATNTVQINQSTDKAIINWQSFNISSQETTQFIQPNASSITLNRINPQQGASQILGKLQANGRIILVNQAGIFFGPGSHIDVAGIIASSSDITNANFLAGNYVFDQSSSLYNGSIINQGTIISANHGLVALVGSAVSNEGLVQAHLGNVVLASGNKFTVGLDQTSLINFTVDEGITSPGVDNTGNALKDAVNNSGTIIADGGTILMTAKAAQNIVDRIINMTGVAQARSVYQKNGEIILAGDQEGTTYVSGTLDASGLQTGETGGLIKVLGSHIFLDSPAIVNVNGDIGGGQIYIGGSGLTNPLSLQNAKNTFVALDTHLSADTITQGNGGKIIIWSNVPTDPYDSNEIHGSTFVGGFFSAKGGINGGDGGFIETSGGVIDIDHVQGMDLSAPLGNTGTWLIDPSNVTISSGGNSNINFASGTYTPTTNTTSNINVATLNGGSRLGSSSITILATQTPGGNAGTITVDAPISWSNANSLTLTASSTVTLNSTITNTGTGSLTINANSGASPIIFNTGSNVTTGGSQTYNGTITVNAPITLQGSAITVGSTLNANANNLTLLADTMTFSGGANSITGTGTLLLAPLTTNATIGLNGGAGTLQITGSNIAALGTTFSSLTIGQATTTGAMNIGGGNFGSQLVNLNAGSFTGTNPNVVIAGTLNFKANTIGGAIGTNLDPVAFSATTLSLNTTGNGNAVISSSGGTTFGTSNLGTGSLTYTQTGAGGTVSQSGTITAGTLTATLTSGALNLLNNNTIANLGPITAPGGLNLFNGNNAITVTGNITTTNTLARINTGTNTYTQNNVDISTGSGTIAILADSIA